MIYQIIQMIRAGYPASQIIPIIAALAVMILFCMPVHEWAHAYTAYKLGDNTARYKGRMTLNPAAHLNLVGTLMMLFVGVGYATAVPVNPLNFKNRKGGMALTACAGPFSNFVMAWVFMLLGKVVFVFGNNVPFADFFFQLAVINVGLMVFNLLPVPPLDGSRILTLFLPERTYFKIMRYEQYIWIAVMVLAFIGVFDPLLNVLRTAFLKFLDILTFFLGRIF